MAILSIQEVAVEGPTGRPAPPVSGSADQGASSGLQQEALWDAGFAGPLIEPSPNLKNKVLQKAASSCGCSRTPDRK